ncbi:MAG: Minf_1886 family protein [Chthoniobacterales bacterium]
MISFHEALNLISQHDTRYHRDAYAFVKESLETLTTVKQKKKGVQEAPRHISAAELLQAFKQCALKEFGPMSITVLDHWGIKSTGDVGSIVLNLVNAGIFSKTEEDTLEAFQSGFDFQDAFVKPFLPTGFGMHASASKE